MPTDSASVPMRTYNWIPKMQTNGKTLYTFSIDTEYKHLNVFGGMVRKISFDNPDSKHIKFIIGGLVFGDTCKDHFDFTVSHSKKDWSDGVYAQVIAIGEQNKITKQLFPEFYAGKVEEHFLNMSRVDRILIKDLLPESHVTLDCYTIIDDATQKPEWETYKYVV
jgi:hypothetical protein